MDNISVCHISSMHDVDDDRIFQRACIGTARKGLKVSYIVTAPDSRNVEGVNIIPIRNRKGWRRRLWSSWEAYKIALHHPHDVYHFHDPDLLIFMVFLRMRGKKVVYDIHENYVVRFRNRGLPVFMENLLMKMWRKYECWAIKRLDGVVSVTKSIYRFFEHCARDHVVISNMVDIDRLSGLEVSDFDKKENIVYVSGSNSPDRNVHNLIKAVPSILKKHEELKFVIAGFYRDGYRERLERLIKDLKIEKAVTLEGALPWIKNFERTNKAVLGCVFWKRNENYSVTIPNRLFEYMFCGLAVLADDTEEVRHIIDSTNCGEFCNSDNPDSIAEAIVDIFNDENMLRQYSENARKGVLEKFNFNTQLENLTAFYSRIVKA